MDVAVPVNDVAAVPPKLTPVTDAMFVPVIVTMVPGAPSAGVNDVIDGVAYQLKLAALVALPPGVVTDMAPVAPDALA